METNSSAWTFTQNYYPLYSANSQVNADILNVDFTRISNTHFSHCQHFIEIVSRTQGLNYLFRSSNVERRISFLLFKINEFLLKFQNMDVVCTTFAAQLKSKAQCWSERNWRKRYCKLTLTYKSYIDEICEWKWFSPSSPNVRYFIQEFFFL